MNLEFCNQCGKMDRLWGGICQECRYADLAKRPIYLEVVNLIKEGTIYSETLANEIGVSRQRIGKILKYLVDNGHVQRAVEPVAFGKRFKYQIRSN